MFEIKFRNFKHNSRKTLDNKRMEKGTLCKNNIY